MFYKVIELLQEIKEEDKPSYLFIENVKNLLSINGGWDFGRILFEMDEIGYDAEWDVLNSKNFGVPQNRERVFIIGYFRGRSCGKVFPIGQNDEIFDEKNTINKKQCGITVNRHEIKGETDISHCLMARDYKGIGNQDMTGVMITEATKKGYDIATEGDSISLSFPNSQSRRGRVGKGVTNSLDTSCMQGTLQGTRIRRLTPKECFRLQGFPDEYFERVAAVNSNSQLYKQAGNSVTVNVIYEIAKKLKRG